jgi:hypothetical protein
MEFQVLDSPEKQNKTLGRIIYSSQKVEAIPVSIYVRKGNFDTCYSINKSWEHYAMWTKQDTKDIWFYFCGVPKSTQRQSVARWLPEA